MTPAEIKRLSEEAGSFVRGATRLSEEVGAFVQEATFTEEPIPGPDLAGMAQEGATGARLYRASRPSPRSVTGGSDSITIVCFTGPDGVRRADGAVTLYPASVVRLTPDQAKVALARAEGGR